MRFDRVMLAAPKSGSGKTTLTCALLQALKNSGQEVIAYKCGPDYIDPMFHQQVIRVPSRNLDTFFTGEEETRRLFLNGRREGSLAVMEGVMGLYDGLGGIREEGSSYHLAKVIRTPIVLVVDAKGMGRSLLPLLAGFMAYDTEHLIRGVLFNRMSAGYYEILKPLVEEELGLQVVGYFPEQSRFSLKSRHLGLLLPEEVEGLQESLGLLAEELKRTVSLEGILEIASSAELLKDQPEAFAPKRTAAEPENGPVIAVARDEAFCFYYEDNLRLLREQGARLVEFSPIHDTELPKPCHGLLLGGGYPELYAKELSRNTAMLQAIKTAAEGNMPVVAECGGFLYLHETLQDKEGHSYRMAGVVKAGCCDKGRLVRFGYLELEEKNENFLKAGTSIRCHEFHYYDSEENGDDGLATKPVTGKQYPCVISRGNRWLGFPHLYYPSNPEFARRFVEKSREWQKCEEE